MDVVRITDDTRIIEDHEDDVRVIDDFALRVLDDFAARIIIGNADEWHSA